MKNLLFFLWGLLFSSLLHAEATLFIRSNTVHPGQTFIVEVGNQKKGPKLIWGEDAIPFYYAPHKKWRALARVPLDAKPGKSELTVESFLGRSRKTVDVSIVVTVLEADFGAETLRFSKEKAELLNDPSEDDESRLIRIYLKIAGEDPQQHWQGKFILPVEGWISSQYGVKREKIGQKSPDFHRGIDIRGSMGDPIQAANGGVVLMAQELKFHGKTILLSHGQGIGTIYIHMSEIDVEEEDVVKKGDIIGRVGSSGLATAPHLHWGLYVHGKAVDPIQWIEQKF